MKRLDKGIGAIAAVPNTSKVALMIPGMHAGADTAAQAGVHASHYKLIHS
jgi:hypothetical protein